MRGRLLLAFLWLAVPSGCANALGLDLAGWHARTAVGDGETGGGAAGGHASGGAAGASTTGAAGHAPADAGGAGGSGTGGASTSGAGGAGTGGSPTTTSTSGSGGAGAGGAGAGCAPPDHLCGGVCRPNIPATGCFASKSCAPCPDVVHGSTTCDAQGACSVACDAGYTSSGGLCICAAECCADADCGDAGITCQQGSCVEVPPSCDQVTCTFDCTAQHGAACPGVCLGETCTCTC